MPFVVTNRQPVPCRGVIRTSARNTSPMAPTVLAPLRRQHSPLIHWGEHRARVPNGWEAGDGSPQRPTHEHRRTICAPSH
jgi:hypothetical protein